MTNRSRFHGRRAVGVGALTAALVIGTPMIPVASAGPASPSAVRTPSAAVGNTYGGVTEQGQPLVIKMTADRRHIVRAITVLEMTCTSGETWVATDRYPRTPVSKRGRFSYPFGPTTERNEDGTTTDYQGKYAGRLNDTKTKITGTWTYTVVDHDVAGAVTDTCTSGAVAFTITQ